MKKIISIMLLMLFSLSALIFSGCDEEKDTYLVSTYMNWARFGEVYGGNDTYEEGSSVTITAVPWQTNSQKDENVFVAWIHDYKVVSKDAQYTFTVNKDTAGDYIALFKNNKTDLEYVSPLGFSLEFGVFADDSINIDVDSYSIDIGYYEDELFQVLSAEADNNNIASIEDIYQDGDLPYTFDKTKDLYVKAQIKYLRGDLEYTTTAIKKINKISLGEQVQKIEILDEFSEATLTGIGTRLEYSKKPSLELNMTKLSDLLLEEAE